VLAKFSVENYRAFSRRQEIEIRPLTLFFGWNSGGKSALVRFLPLLAESIRVDGPPIWLAGEVGRGATWSEVVCKATERGGLGFSLQWENDLALTAEWEVAGDVEGRWQETKSLSATSLTSDVAFNRVDSPERLWRGLTPIAHDNDNDLTDRLRRSLKELASEVQWVSGVRVAPPRVSTYGGGAPPTLRPDGRDAVTHLVAAQLQSSAAPLLEATGTFFAALGERLLLDNPTEGVWRVMLHPSGAPQVRVNLCDTGEGYAQVLPVLVALARARVGGPRLLCLEQPELHLHTRAQVELSRLLVATAKDAARPRVLVETHSEVLLMSVQLAIAKGEIDPDMVRVYWVESRSDGTSDAVAVDFSEEGQPVGSALAGAFGEAVGLGQELVLRQIPRARI
jgi:hypothetical protein